jgi:VanZ family protein
MTSPPRALSLLIPAGTAAYWLVIFAGTHAPGNVIHAEGYTDKVYHFSAFFGLAMLLCGSASCFQRLRPVHFAAIVGLAAGYGIFDELTQLLVPNRTADPLDWLADISGATLAAVLFSLLQRLFFAGREPQGTTG